MIFKLIETLFYLIISNTHNLLYMVFLLSMFENAGLFGLVYPLSMFGYAMLEETRPRTWYWNFIFKYTIVLLIVKFTINLSILDGILTDPTFIRVNAYMKIGIYNYDDKFRTIKYMAPEIMILALCILNEIKLKLLGLFYQIEEDIETLEDGIQRNIHKGDENVLKLIKKDKTGMVMSYLFDGLEHQKRNEAEVLKDEFDQRKQEYEE